MAKRKRRNLPKPSAQVRKTTDLVTGVVGLGVAGAVGATLPGLPGVITMGGTLPIAATSLMGVAGKDYSKKKRRRKK